MRTKKKTWRMTRRKGEPVLISPTGRIYYGTPKEIREMSMYPRRRNELAETIRFYRELCAEGKINKADMDFILKRRRLDAINFDYFDRVEIAFGLDEDMKLKICAASRATGIEDQEYLVEAINAALEATRGKIGGELPYTRYETAALAATERYRRAKR